MIGIIGCGSIGKAVASSFENVIVFDADCRKALEVAKVCNAIAVKSFDDLMQHNPEIVLEAASQEAVRMYAERVLEKADMVVMSVGAFADPHFFRRVVDVARKNSKRLVIPSGAIAGIDAIKAVAEHVEEVVLTTRKNPRSLGVEADRERVVFEGNVMEAVKLYPKNINVACTLALAAGFEKVRVRIIADPSVTENIHQIAARGEFGELKIEIKNRPMPNNPKTSYLAALSAVKALRDLRGKVVIGT